jgi:hypothetical protein
MSVVFCNTQVHEFLLCCTLNNHQTSPPSVPASASCSQPPKSSSFSPFNIDVIVDDALGTEGATVVVRDSFDQEENEEDFGGWEHEAEAGTEGGEV